jgi:hypothetical protein
MGPFWTLKKQKAKQTIEGVLLLFLEMGRFGNSMLILTFYI